MAFHIVVIDDDPPLQEFYQLLLEKEGYRVTIAPTLELDVAAITALKPDLIILDLLIGGKQRGWSFFERLKSDARTANVPLLVVTALAANSVESEGKESLQEHAISLIFKPFDIDTLLTAIHRALFQVSPSPSEIPGNDLLK